jgi:hypothetical protein
VLAVLLLLLLPLPLLLLPDSSSKLLPLTFTVEAPSARLAEHGQSNARVGVIPAWLAKGENVVLLELGRQLMLQLVCQELGRQQNLARYALYAC